MADLSRRLEGMLLEDFAKAKAPPGMAKCPACGAVIEPTRTKRIRVHESNPLDGTRCEAGGRPWAEYGKRPPAAKAAKGGKAPKPRAAKAGPKAAGKGRKGAGKESSAGGAARRRMGRASRPARPARRGKAEA